LEEPEVKRAIVDWIKSEHPDWYVWRRWHFDVVAGPSKSQPSLAVECKGGSSRRHKAQRAIGQCLDYMTESIFANVPCFIATPKNFPDNQVILKTLEYQKLPIGLLVVGDDGRVTILREAKRIHSRG